MSVALSGAGESKQGGLARRKRVGAEAARLRSIEVSRRATPARKDVGPLKPRPLYPRKDAAAQHVKCCTDIFKEESVFMMLIYEEEADDSVNF